MAEPLSGLELRSTITSNGMLKLSLVESQLIDPAPDEVVVRVEAAPLNPSDLGLLLGPADLATMQVGGSKVSPTLTAKVPPHEMAGLAGRLDRPLAVGNEGAGTVVRAGETVADLLGKKVGMLGGGMYAQFRRLPAQACVVIPDGVSAADGASMFVNPLTALAFIETMKREGHSAMVHTAAASNLGQMLVKVASADGIPLVNIVRSREQAALLSAFGATHILDSTVPDFEARLADAVAATGATLAFDAVGGGRLAGQILTAMEAAANRQSLDYSRYGSSTLKQVYIYGGLDVGPTILDRTYGMAWGVGGWLMLSALQKIGGDIRATLLRRVVEEVTTTFSSRYTATINLLDVLNPACVSAFHRKSTGQKYLIDPSA